MKKHKKYSIEDLQNNNNLASVEETKELKTEKTEVKFSPKRKKNKKRRRIIIASVLTVLLAFLGYFGWIGYNALKNIFEGDPLFNLFNPKQLKGESSGRVNFLLLGVGDRGHAGEGLSDTIMVVSLDTKSNDVAMISVPRDLYVKIGDYGYSKINAAHAYGEMYKYNGGGPGLAKETISAVIDQPIHYYIRADFTGFKKIIDIVGGVDINVEKDLYDPLYPGGTFYITKGVHHMNGETALKYARSRETTSDFDRAKRQQQVLVALKEKVLSTQTLLNPKKVTEIISAVGEHIKTDMQVWEGQRAVEIAKKVDASKIINKVIDNSASGLLVSNSSPQAGYTLIPRLGIGNYDEIQQMVKNIFIDSKLITEDAKISILNGTARSGLATRLSEKLKNAGIDVVNVSTADRTNYSSTIIKDGTNGQKSATIKYLEDLVKGKTETSTLSGGSDIEIILGNDYTE